MMKIKLTYSSHAKDEWANDRLEFIKHRPLYFIPSVCKKIENQDDGVIRATYRYNNRLDLILVIKDNFVITNYLKINLKNKEDFKGSFYVAR